MIQLCAQGAYAPCLLKRLLELPKNLRLAQHHGI